MVTWVSAGRSLVSRLSPKGSVAESPLGGFLNGRRRPDRLELHRPRHRLSPICVRLLEVALGLVEDALGQREVLDRVVGMLRHPVPQAVDVPALRDVQGQEQEDADHRDGRNHGRDL
jgi:hypothetical protein